MSFATEGPVVSSTHAAGSRRRSRSDAGTGRLAPAIRMKQRLPCPLRAGIAHYQYATIHPYYDGNGRTARLLHDTDSAFGRIRPERSVFAGGVLPPDRSAAYYETLTIGLSHNYYFGRVDADITKWVEVLLPRDGREF